ncbi:hypothetical protein CDD80_3366 [Ophiocordyceps camponoti-rufipedis]|uniref:Uncharacterized protein n=1 Tax=Ophiocordyceps camponoti-rufipedis TaxID=2004952 RepID=A0A2C5ZNU3_9HYPO|nr:hypothetical protein CDD80_3366 [Ophiocordyceps camponoti-rufipedis]
MNVDDSEKGESAMPSDHSDEYIERVAKPPVEEATLYFANMFIRCALNYGQHPKQDRPLRAHLIGIFDEVSGRYSKRCDYTGLELSWSPGPRSVSMEAPDQFVQIEQGLGHHEPPNVRLIMTTWR